MKPSHGALIYEGKAKRVFASNDPEKVLVEFKNDTTAFNASKREELEGKGKLNCQISACLFDLLEEKGVATHFIALEEDDWMTVQRIQVIPLEIVIRNVAFGSLCKETPIKAGEPLPIPLCDLYYKDDQLGDPLLTDARLELLGLITTEERNRIEEIALNVNKILKSFFNELDVLLVDFKLEMGFNQKGDLLVADEISPDNCRLWDLRNMDSKGKILDKDRFRKDLGGVVEAYGEILKRIQRIP